MLPLKMSIAEFQWDGALSVGADVAAVSLVPWQRELLSLLVAGKTLTSAPVSTRKWRPE